MEMYNEGLADNAAMICGTNVPVEPPSLDQHPDVKQVRKYLFIFTGTDLVSGCNRKRYLIRTHLHV